MSVEDDFKAAQDRAQKLTSKPSNDDLLELYALYKQGTAGDVTGARPGFTDFKGRAKFDAWAGKKGVGKEDAQKRYVALVARLAK